MTSHSAQDAYATDSANTVAGEPQPVVSDATLDQLVELAAWTFDVPMVALVRQDEQGLVFLGQHGLPVSLQASAVHSGLMLQATLRNGYDVVPDTHAHDGWSAHSWAQGEGSVRFAASVALTDADGDYVGALAIYDTQPRTLSDRHARMLTALARLATDHLGLRTSLSTISSLHEELEQAHGWLLESASQDGLTQIANRRALMTFMDKTLALSRRERQPLTVMLLDVREFRQINEAYGDSTGDRVLREVATRLSACARGSEMVGRMAGDEFMAVLYPCSPEQAELAANRYVKAVSAGPVELGAAGGAKVTIQVSTGLFTTVHTVAHTADELYRQVALALDQGKAQQRM